MSDIIKILPEALANQIAACEVIERPASVVKELMENAIDAGAKQIELILKNGGKTLIQIVDDGVGMSHSDARTCFERHATSKINTIDDLFRIKTMGFRGEALASVCGVSQVELKTKTTTNEVGTIVRIEGSKIAFHDFIQTTKGTNISVKNLFYNIPARKNAMKINNTEYKHILNIFKRMAFCHPKISFKLVNEGVVTYMLSSGDRKERFRDLFGKNYLAQIIEIDEEASFFTVKGYLGKPEMSKKHFGEQYLFINQRSVRDSFMHQAIVSAFDSMIEGGKHPSYFLFIEIDPKYIDVNVDPHKKHIKFFREKEVYDILKSIIRSALGSFHLNTSLDMNEDSLQQQTPVKPHSDFENNQKKIMSAASSFSLFGDKNTNPSTNKNWESLYEITKQENSQSQSLFPTEETTENTVTSDSHSFFQVNKNIIAINSNSLAELRLVNIKNAQQRLLYEKLKRNTEEDKFIQKLLMPVTHTFSQHEWEQIDGEFDFMNSLGFDIRPIGNQTVIIDGVPSFFADYDIEKLMNEIKESFFSEQDNRFDKKEKMLIVLSTRKVLKKEVLSAYEMEEFVKELFECQNSNFSPTGKKISVFMTVDDLEKLFE